MIKRGRPANGQIKLTFMVRVDQAPGGLSLVGDFNDWDANAHPMRVREGVYEISLTISTDQSLCFRYLAAGGVWFDDADADYHDQQGGHLRALTSASPGRSAVTPD
ncbi:isoamylase early set domain-containing protein [Nonomuraea recticatena]|uniref:Glycoside hydrolase family 13 N-terminal domain-containing protein n=1 Tax=Nonomuraea recticatena TaxID=46178 RepID=A0ABP6FXS7_9ACTN